MKVWTYSLAGFFPPLRLGKRSVHGRSKYASPLHSLFAAWTWDSLAARLIVQHLARIIHQPFYCGLKYLQNQNLSSSLAYPHSGAMRIYLSP